MQKRDKYDNIDITEKRYGRLVAKEKVGKSKWLLRCDCGNYVTLNYSRLLCGQKSCGCLRKECEEDFAKAQMKHGKSRTKLYRKCRSMINRCYNRNDPHYKRYGERGIEVCDEWRNSFEAFYDWAYKNGYDENIDGQQWSLDRKDNSRGYSPDNCRFTTPKEQARNRDITSLYEYKGKEYSAFEFADIYGISDKSFVYNRLKKGQTLEFILNDWERAHNIPQGLVDTETYAKMKNVTITTVNRWIKNSRVKAEKRGRKWYIEAN